MDKPSDNLDGIRVKTFNDFVLRMNNMKKILNSSDPQIFVSSFRNNYDFSFEEFCLKTTEDEEKMTFSHEIYKTKLTELNPVQVELSSCGNVEVDVETHKSKINLDDYLIKMSPFDELELKSVNDIEELKNVLHSTTKIKSPTAADNSSFQPSGGSLLSTSSSQSYKEDHSFYNNMPSSSTRTPYYYSPDLGQHHYDNKEIEDQSISGKVESKTFPLPALADHKSMTNEIKGTSQPPVKISSLPDQQKQLPRLNIVELIPPDFEIHQQQQHHKQHHNRDKTAVFNKHNHHHQSSHMLKKFKNYDQEFRRGGGTVDKGGGVYLQISNLVTDVMGFDRDVTEGALRYFEIKGDTEAEIKPILDHLCSLNSIYEKAIHFSKHDCQKALFLNEMDENKTLNFLANLHTLYSYGFPVLASEWALLAYENDLGKCIDYLTKEK